MDTIRKMNFDYLCLETSMLGTIQYNTSRFQMNDF